ncbi:NUDIX hydrolase [Deinococcus sp. QL22]|uniref:NUDIX hydrolase n=1 Tax=Deinococcus sp. QL22 TaxID=2939437 RepID=UPI0020181A96|nr:NUDIX hydrolase [Deinococcus sp. QL22]UQN06009.1 NUDIX hydrolase [Deinococcus sp. QL22]
MTLKLMADYHCFPLWKPDGDNLDPATLGVPTALAARLEAWADTFDSTLNRADPMSPLPMRATFLGAGENEDAAFEREGHALWWALRAALPGQQVGYFSTLLGRVIEAGDDELLDRLDDAGEVTGVLWRSVSDGVKGVRGVNAFFRNSAGQLLLPRRAAHKPRWPGALDFSVGGYTLAGESLDESFVREAREELNVNVAALGWHVLGDLSPFDTGVSCFMRIYEVDMNDLPHQNPDDFNGADWLTPEQLLERAAKGEMLKPDLLKVIDLVYAKQ